jgi:hypothetical protein
MAGSIRSARGAMVDFDLLKIKQQIASAPKTVIVEARENFIDNKFKRQLKGKVREAIDLANDQVIDISSPKPLVIPDALTIPTEEK